MELTPAKLHVLHRHVIDLPDGDFPSGPSVDPKSEKSFSTTVADLDLIIESLEEFVTARRKKSISPVPVVLYAHGGLIAKEAGLRIADAQVSWWTSNGAYPVHFAWHTGFAESLWTAVKDAAKRPREAALENIWDLIIESAAREGQGGKIWGAMKDQAERVCGAAGGAGLFVEKLGLWMQSHKNWVTVHAVGHSAGSIFHSYLLPHALSAGVPRIDSLSLLAPAVRIDTFKSQLLADLKAERIDSLAVFTMRKKLEEDDDCLGVYRKSLLYLIRAALEKEKDAAILGLEECIERDHELTSILDGSGRKGSGDVIWSTTDSKAEERSRSTAKSHGAFDTDGPTMTSVAHRIFGQTPVKEYPAVVGRSLSDPMWPSAAEARGELEAAMAGRGGNVRQGARRALCIGIDAYPGKYALTGCVADAQAWAAEFTSAGFTVELLTNEKASRKVMLAKITELVTKSSAGDVIALQYSGHGTTITDIDHDEGKDSNLEDEALCPQDFVDGNLIIDDDLGAIWDQLPKGVSLSIFFDSCHSGGAQRAVPLKAIAENQLARYAPLTAATLDAFEAKRAGARAIVRKHDEPAYFFAACRADEVAWESNSRGDFSTRAVPLLAAAFKKGETNEQLNKRILAAFGPDRKQTPLVNIPKNLKNRPVLSSSLNAARGAAGADISPDIDVETALGELRRLGVPDDKLAELLHSIANLIDK
jgi:Caspase domain